MNKVLKYVLPGFLLCAAAYLSLMFFGPQKLSLEEAYADPEVMAFLTESGRLNELPVPEEKPIFQPIKNSLQINTALIFHPEMKGRMKDLS